MPIGYYPRGGLSLPCAAKFEGRGREAPSLLERFGPEVSISVVDVLVRNEPLDEIGEIDCDGEGAPAIGNDRAQHSLDLLHELVSDVRWIPRAFATSLAMCKSSHMATNLAIDDRLLEEAQKIGGHRTKKATVTEALTEYIQRRRQQRILELFGKVTIDPKYDYKAQRRRR